METQIVLLRAPFPSVRTILGVFSLSKAVPGSRHSTRTCQRCSWWLPDMECAVYSEQAPDVFRIGKHADFSPRFGAA